MVKSISKMPDLHASGCEPYISRWNITSEFDDREKWGVMMHKLPKLEVPKQKRKCGRAG
jgi:hypothetical protein